MGGTSGSPTRGRALRGVLQSRLSPGDYSDLAALGRPINAPAGAVLVGQGAASPPVYFLHDGIVKVTRQVTRHPDSRPMIIEVAGPGDVLGAEVALRGGRSHVGYEISQPIQALEIPQNTFLAFLRNHPNALVALSTLLANKLTVRDASLSYATHEVRVRLVAFLDKMAATYGRKTDQGIVIDIGFGHSDIASAIGASHVSVHRQLKALQQAGYIDSAYRSIVLKRTLPLNAGWDDAYLGGHTESGEVHSPDMP
jgi:CRP/FNR family cyclic AMP-dependent transcriptional regulator